MAKIRLPFMKAKYICVVLAAFAVGVLVVRVVSYSSRTIATRVTYLDLAKIYTNITAAGANGYELRASGYPTVTGLEHYYVKTPRGSMTLECSLDDQNIWIPSRREWELGPPSRPIGDEAFFMNQTSSPEALQLAYRRYNVAIRFRNHPQRDYRNGQPVLDIEQDKLEMEEMALVMDKAIISKHASVMIEDVRGSRVLSNETRLWVWLLLALIFASWPIYLVGGFLCMGVWPFSRRLSAIPRLALRSLVVAATLAPGMAFGHGFAPVPAIYVLYAYLFDWPSNMNPNLGFVWGVMPVALTWLAAMTVLSLALLWKNKRASRSAEDRYREE